jgi:hypothetical protein
MPSLMRQLAMRRAVRTYGRGLCHQILMAELLCIERGIHRAQEK